MNRRRFIEDAVGFSGLVLGGLALNPKHAYGRRAKHRVSNWKLKNLKIDLRPWLIRGKPGALDENGIPTEKGIAYWGEYVEAIREGIGPDIVMGADHFGRMTVESGIKLGKYMAAPERNLACISMNPAE